jgi:hypothetical protein
MGSPLLNWEINWILIGLWARRALKTTGMGKEKIWRPMDQRSSKLSNTPSKYEYIKPISTKIMSNGALMTSKREC